MSRGRILILDDDEDVACAARLLLRRKFAQIDWLSRPETLDIHLIDGKPDVVLLDFNFSAGRTDGAEGLALLEKLAAIPHPPVIIAMTAYADVPLAVKALKLGASDFITKPWDNDRLVSMIEAALESRLPHPQSDTNAVSLLLGYSAAMRQLRSMIASVAPTEANVLILGENGVGKELVAREIHLQSRRKAAPFQAVDMGSIPDSTFESELYGHKRGAFTDARQDRPGRFISAQGGTLFLDEIGNMALSAQAKLLTALERRVVTPVGSDKPVALDVRIVSATNLDEARLFDANTFRTDLLFRLNTIVLRVAPLRDRRDDIPALLKHFLTLYAAQYHRPERSIANDALNKLTAYDWPGNVRALRHSCERATILAEGNELQFEDFGLGRQQHPLTQDAAVTSGRDNVDQTLALQERMAVTEAMSACDGNISQAAKKLGLSRAALYRRLEKHGL